MPPASSLSGLIQAMSALSKDLTQCVQASTVLAAAFPEPTAVEQRVSLAREVLEVPLRSRSLTQQALLYEVFKGLDESALVTALAPAHRYDLRLVELAQFSPDGLRQMTRWLVEEGQIQEACALVGRYPDVTMGALLTKVCRVSTAWGESLTATVDGILARGPDAGALLAHAIAQDIQRQGFTYWDTMEVYDQICERVPFLAEDIEKAWQAHLPDCLVGRWLFEGPRWSESHLQVLEALSQRPDAQTIAREALGVLESQVDAQAEAEGIPAAQYVREHMPTLLGELVRVGVGEPWRSIWQASPLLADLRVLDRQDQLTARPAAPARPSRRRS